MASSRVAAPGDGDTPGPETFTITQLAGEFGVTTRAIRFYEDKELIHPRRNGLNRVYSRRDRARLNLILRGKRLGFSLADIKEMLDLYDLGDGQREQMRVTLRKGQERLAALRAQRQDIDDAIGELEDACRYMQNVMQKKSGR